MIGESIHWAGIPDPRVIFHSDDWAAIPFSFVWTGFFVFLEAQAFGFWGAKPQRDGNLFMELWGIPFLVMGNYFVWGRFLWDAWLKRRTYYAVTNRRVLVLQEGWKRNTSMMFPEEMAKIEKEGASGCSPLVRRKISCNGAEKTENSRYEPIFVRRCASLRRHRRRGLGLSVDPWSPHKDHAETIF